MAHVASGGVCSLCWHCSTMLRSQFVKCFYLAPLSFASVGLTHRAHDDLHQHLKTCCTLHIVGLQQMWEDMGVNWEWTWYAQTAHAFTQPQLVGAAASAVSLFCCTVLYFTTCSSEQLDNDTHMACCYMRLNSVLDCKHSAAGPHN